MRARRRALVASDVPPRSYAVAARLYVGNDVFVPRGTQVVPTHPFTNACLRDLVWPPFELVPGTAHGGESI